MGGNNKNSLDIARIHQPLPSNPQVAIPASFEIEAEAAANRIMQETVLQAFPPFNQIDSKFKTIELVLSELSALERLKQQTEQAKAREEQKKAEDERDKLIITSETDVRAEILVMCEKKLAKRQAAAQSAAVPDNAQSVAEVKQLSPETRWLLEAPEQQILQVDSLRDRLAECERKLEIAKGAVKRPSKLKVDVIDSKAERRLHETKEMGTEEMLKLGITHAIEEKTSLSEKLAQCERDLQNEKLALERLEANASSAPKVSDERLSLRIQQGVTIKRQEKEKKIAVLAAKKNSLVSKIAALPEEIARMESMKSSSLLKQKSALEEELRIKIPAVIALRKEQISARVLDDEGDIQIICEEYILNRIEKICENLPKFELGPKDSPEEEKLLKIVQQIFDKIQQGSSDMLSETLTKLFNCLTPEEHIRCKEALLVKIIADIRRLETTDVLVIGGKNKRFPEIHKQVNNEQQVGLARKLVFWAAVVVTFGIVAGVAAIYDHFWSKPKKQYEGCLRGAVKKQLAYTTLTIDRFCGSDAQKRDGQSEARIMHRIERRNSLAAKADKDIVSLRALADFRKQYPLSAIPKSPRQESKQAAAPSTAQIDVSAALLLHQQPQPHVRQLPLQAQQPQLRNPPSAQKPKLVQLGNHRQAATSPAEAPQATAPQQQFAERPQPVAPIAHCWYSTS